MSSSTPLGDETTPPVRTSRMRRPRSCGSLRQLDQTAVSESINNADTGMTGRHSIRKRLHLRRKDFRQALLRIGKSKSSRLRVNFSTGTPLADITSPVSTVGGSPAPRTPPPRPKTITRSTTVESLKSLASVARVDHLRRLVFKRFIQSGLVWERMENTSGGEISTSRGIVLDMEEQTTQRDTAHGWDVLFEKNKHEEAKEEIAEGATNGVNVGSSGTSRSISGMPMDVIHYSTPPKPPSIKRTSSLSNLSSPPGRATSTRGSLTTSEDDDDMLMPFDSYDDDDERMMEAIRQEILNEGRTSMLSQNLQKIHNILRAYAVLFPTDQVHQEVRLEQLPVRVRLEGVSYQARQRTTAGKIPTVYNTSLAYPITKAVKRYYADGYEAAVQQLFAKPTYETVDILQNINLVLHPGRSYLVLGPPGSGKTSLLKAIAGRLRADFAEDDGSRPDDELDHVETGRQSSLTNSTNCQAPPEKTCTIMKGNIRYNGRTITEGGKEFSIENAIVYIDQLDQHAPRLTVDETLEFAFQCKTGGDMFRDKIAVNEDMRLAMERATAERLRVDVTLQALGLTHVRDTYVGDQTVRGISGGQRRRVTVGEMIMDRSPVMAGDEISTGLDAASTYDMMETLLYLGRLANMTRVMALLQPSPETVSLFDEVILLGEGRILYAGPMQDVEAYFADLGYKSPNFVDVADFLQLVSTEDGASLYQPSAELQLIRPMAPTIQELADIFEESSYGRRIRDELKEPHHLVWRRTDDGSTHGSRVSGVTRTDTVTKEYANSFGRSTWLIMKRFLTLWTRNVQVIFAGSAKNIIMGVSVGGVFSSTEDEVSITGAFFQAGLFIMLQAIQSSSTLVTDRVIFYKHADANFYSALPFVMGRTLSNFPQTFCDVVLFGTIMYYMVGLAGRAEFDNFLKFLCILITFALVMQQQLAVFASFTSASGLQVCSSIILLFLILFGGFIVSPEVIPAYWRWAYWWNPFAWAYRALVINEFRSGRWEDPNAILARLGFDDVSDQEWVGMTFFYLGAYFVLCGTLTAVGLTFVRNTGGGRPKSGMSRERRTSEEEIIVIPFKPVNISFHEICYDVTASKGNATLRLLNNVNGIFRSGRMCALMGSSGAGKSTLLDVIAGRKTAGTVLGEVRLNGFVQDPIAFRRASGYVEQFDVQSPELTVRETVLFSAQLRIDRDAIDSEDQIRDYADAVLRDVELDDLADVLVGDEGGSGLSFEQKKRLSIAVELAASPSIIFLDEPTSGLDARSALLVVRTLRKIANAGRTICATIHQPSSTVFDMFDDLLLLRKGGEVVYHGPTGKGSHDLVHYFESLGAPRIELGENPANWMLRLIGDDDMGELPKKFRLSTQFHDMKEELALIATQPEPDVSRKIEYAEQFATIKSYRQPLVTSRVRAIYWRSPAYNLARLMVSGTVAFVLGSLFLWARFDNDFTEADIRARLSVVFLSFIITGMLAIFGSIPVMTKLRDMFYRHRIAGMYGSSSIGMALGAAEKPFILFSSTIFTAVFLSTASMMDNEGKRFIRGLLGFWGFFTFNFAIYSYFGQAFVCLVKPTATAIILSGIFIGLNNFFSGLIVRPQFMVGSFFALPYYICPGHYVFEGLVTSLYAEDQRYVFADNGSDFWLMLVAKECAADAVSQEACCTGTSLDEVCIGTVDEYIRVFFGNHFVIRHTPRNAMILGFVLILTRLLTFLSLKYIRFSK